MLELIYQEIGNYLKPEPRIEDIRIIFETEGKVPAIKAWRSANTDYDGDVMGLKDAKDQVESAASKFGWRDYRVGKRCTILSNQSYGVIEKVVEQGSGFYVNVNGSSTYFHQSSICIIM